MQFILIKLGHFSLRLSVNINPKPSYHLTLSINYEYIYECMNE